MGKLRFMKRSPNEALCSEAEPDYNLEAEVQRMAASFNRLGNERIAAEMDAEFDCMRVMDKAEVHFSARFCFHILVELSSYSVFHTLLFLSSHPFKLTFLMSCICIIS